jgi:hypothetical protein
VGQPRSAAGCSELDERFLVAHFNEEELATEDELEDLPRAV